jgi:hypothetical protein
MGTLAMLEKNLWLLYVALAGLSWGTYVPLIFFGGTELGKTPQTALGGRLMAILCVGVAYFVLAVLIPLGMFLGKQAPLPDMSATGLTFAALAGVAGAVGAICVIFASKEAVAAARASNLPPATFRVYIAPLIFGLAPVINVVVSTVWHPRSGEPFHFAFDAPGWKLWVGIILVGAGAALVLFSKEEAEAAKQSPPKPAATAPAAVVPETPQ